MTSHPDRTQQPSEEDRRFLDALVFLRRLYGVRGPRDSASTSTLSTVMETVQLALTPAT